MTDEADTKTPDRPADDTAAANMAMASGAPQTSAIRPRN